MRGFVVGLIVIVAGSAPASAADSSQICRMGIKDSAWLESALHAWRQVSTKRLNLERHEQPTIVVYDAQCRFEKVHGHSTWKAESHTGSIRIPGGTQIPAQVTSFASSDEKTGTPFFVMALPSIWEAAKISRDAKGLTGVFLHEFSHTRQVTPLRSVFEAAEAVRKMSDDFSDDSLQKHFQTDPAYVAVIEKEIDLLYRAAAEPDPAAARKLAANALALMEARQNRWFRGDDAYWKYYDDLFLTMEGFGQWVAYAWLADPAGGGLAPVAARDKMRGTRWWSQEEGLALFLVIDRFVPHWTTEAFATPPKLGIDLLRQAVTEPR